MATNCLEYGITVNNVSVRTGIEKGTRTLTSTASTGERAFNGLGPLGAVPPVGSRGQASVGVRGRIPSPLKLQGRSPLPLKGEALRP